MTGRINEQLAGVAERAPGMARNGEDRNGDRNESQTVLRACEVLKAFRHLGEELQLGEVMERTGLPKTTTFRLLRTLIHGGLIERASAGVYRNSFGPITARPFRIGFASQQPEGGGLGQSGAFHHFAQLQRRAYASAGASRHAPACGPLAAARHAVAPAFDHGECRRGRGLHAGYGRRRAAGG